MTKSKFIYHLHRLSNRLRTLVALPFIVVAAVCYGIWYVITNTD